MGFFDKLKNGLTKTRESIAKQVNNVFSVFVKVDDELFENLEEALIMADIGVETSTYIIEKLRDNVKHKHITDGNLVKEELKSIISEILSALDTTVNTSTTPSVILVIGVNGVGKTTSIGKIASHYKSMGKKVLLAAADTFRAAAIDQLDIWAQRSGCDIIKHQENSDPAAVVFDACTAAKTTRACSFPATRTSRTATGRAAYTTRPTFRTPATLAWARTHLRSSAISSSTKVRSWSSPAAHKRRPAICAPT